MTFDQTLQAISDVLAEPTSNLAAAALLAAAATLIVLMVILVLLMIAIGPSRRPATARSESESDHGSGEDERAGRRRRVPRSTSLTIVVLVLAAFATSWVASGLDAFCTASCHAPDAESAIVIAPAHDDVDCIACHEDPAPLGIVANPPARLGHVLRFAALSEADYVESTPSSRCEHCHDLDELDAASQESSTATRIVRMSHSEPSHEGLQCVECHGNVAHDNAGPAPAMVVCVRCHDGVQAASTCETCHDSDAADLIAASGRRPYPQVRLGPVDDCGGCHAEDTCDECHGIRMPHTTEFIEGAHARDAGFSKKQVCWRCHPETDCGACHAPFDSGHGPNIFAWHAGKAWDSDCGTCHKGHVGSFCARCHDIPE